MTDDVLATIASLRAFAAEQHERASAAECVAEGLRRYLSAEGNISLEEALGIAARRGDVPWWVAERRDRERTAARALFAAAPGADARTVHRRLRRFADGRGRHAPHAHEQPFETAAREFLEAAGRVPDSPRTLQRAADA